MSEEHIIATIYAPNGFNGECTVVLRSYDDPAPFDSFETENRNGALDFVATVHPSADIITVYEEFKL